MNIKELRTKHGLTLKELADKMEVSVATVSRWEKAPEKLKQETYQKLMEIFGEIQEESGDVVTIRVEVPQLTRIQAQFMSTLNLETLSEQISALGYLNHILRRSNTTTNYYRDLLLKEWKKDVRELVELLGTAILTKKWNTDAPMYYMVKLPTGQYLCKYQGEHKERYGYSVEKSELTVKTSTKEELETLFPEYKPFIVFEPYVEKPLNDVRKEFTVREKHSLLSPFGKTKKG